MPLLDLQTNLTTLKFGKDRLNGDSGQPYIKTPILDNRYATQRPPQTLVDLARVNQNSLDYPIRGGGLDFEIGSQTLTITSRVDRERIRKFLSDKPRGEAFVNKQIGLQLSNPKIETGNTLTNPFASISALPGILENTRVYNNGQNTLAQVGVAGTGVNLPRHGLFPFDMTAKYYDKVVGAQNRMSAEEVAMENRLLILQQLKLRSSDQILSNDQVPMSINKINQLGISLNRNLIQNYVGGPGSTYGIGTTSIRRFDDTSAAVKKYRSEIGMSYDQLMRQTINDANRSTMNKVDGLEGRKVLLDIQDFKKSYDGRFKIESREIIYSMSNINQGDQINSGSLLTTRNNEDPWKIPKRPDARRSLAVNDIIKFGFECINNDDKSNSLFLQFRAYLTNGITDNHQGTYTSFKYLGRGEDFFTYQGFSRTVNFGFRVAVENVNDLVSTYNKLNALASQVYPDYSDNGIMRTSLVKLTIGDYMRRVPGILETVNITVSQDSSWETEDDYQLPHYVDVTVTFKPIHDQIPERVTTTNLGNDNRIIYNVKQSSRSSVLETLNKAFYKSPIDRTPTMTPQEFLQINSPDNPVTSIERE